MTAFDSIDGLLRRRNLTADSMARIVVSGSQAWMAATPHSAHSGDDDYVAIRIERFDELVVGNPDRQSLMIRTQPNGARSHPGDIDLNVYTLRKFAQLAASGNPTMLGTLWTTHDDLVVSDDGTVHWETLRQLAASRKAGNAFAGYMHQQYERWTGVRGQKNVVRPELVAAHGYDVKYAAHALRLGHWGIEYMRTGTLNLPMTGATADSIAAVRSGHIPETQALDWADTLHHELNDAIATSSLPDTVDQTALNQWIADTYRQQVHIHLNQVGSQMRGGKASAQFTA